MPGFDSHDAVILTISSCGGSLYSRVAIQKLVYFHALRIDGFSPHYAHHFYGPFSREVAAALYSLAAAAFVNEVVHAGPGGGYAYELTKDGRKYAESSLGEFPRESGQIAETVETCKKFCGLKPEPLSYAAKCHYMLINSGKDKYTVDDVSNAGKNLSRAISDDDVNAGVDLLKGLRLVE